MKVHVPPDAFAAHIGFIVLIAVRAVDCRVKLAVAIPAYGVGAVPVQPGDRDSVWDWHLKRLVPDHLLAPASGDITAKASSY